MVKKNEQQNTFLGMPSNWDSKNILSFKNTWNKEENKIFLPKEFGLGWTINFHAVLRKARLIKKNTDAN